MKAGAIQQRDFSLLLSQRGRRLVCEWLWVGDQAWVSSNSVMGRQACWTTASAMLCRIPRQVWR